MASKGKTREKPGDDANALHISGQAMEALSGLPHTLTIDQAATEISSNLNEGLTSVEAESRLQKYGRNELDDGPGVSPVKILVRQVANSMTLVKRTTRPIVDTDFLIQLYRS